jgi:hypothetical protein
VSLKWSLFFRFCQQKPVYNYQEGQGNFAHANTDKDVSQFRTPMAPLSVADEFPHLRIWEYFQVVNVKSNYQYCISKQLKTGILQYKYFLQSSLHAIEVNTNYSAQLFF